MIKAYRLRNALLNGSYDAGTLETFLGDQINKATFQLVISDPVWLSDIFVVQAAGDALLGSAAARLALWQSYAAMVALNKSNTIKRFLFSKSTAKTINSTSIGTHPTGKWFLISIKFPYAQPPSQIDNFDGGSLGLPPIKNTTINEQILVRGFSTLSFTGASQTIDIKYIQV